VPITWTTNIVQSGLSPLEHQFWLYSSDGWRIVKDYSASNTFTWTPAEAGTYYLQARVRLAGSTIPYHGWAGGGTTTINPPAAVSISSFTSNVSFPQPAGAAVTFTTTASGGVGPLQYQFWLQDPISGYSIVREYSSTNTYTWTPLRPGNYTMHIWVRSAGSTAAWQAVSSSGSFTVNGVVPYVLSLTADKPLPVAVNTPLVWTAQAARGTTPLEYQFWRGGTTGKTLVQDYSSSATYSWTPTTTDNWVYLEVWVREQGSTASVASLVSSAFQVVSGPVQMVSFTVNQVFPAAARTPIVWTTRSTGGTAPLQYKFLLYDRTTAVWTTAQDWSANPQFAWTPALSEFGVHAVQVYVRSTGSTAEYEAHFAPGFFGITP
jgi:N-acetylmuramoyl-L-alanine amidase